MTGQPSTTEPETVRPRGSRITLPTGLLIRRPELGALAQPGVVLGLAHLESA